MEFFEMSLDPEDRERLHIHEDNLSQGFTTFSEDDIELDLGKNGLENKGLQLGMRKSNESWAGVGLLFELELLQIRKQGGNVAEILRHVGL